jgi:hypothetical protein
MLGSFRVRCHYTMNGGGAVVRWQVQVLTSLQVVFNFAVEP